MEREVGGENGMGKTCKLKAVSFQCMTKFTTNLKKKCKKKKKRNKLACLEIIKTKPLDINNINVQIESSMDILTTEFMPMQRE